MKTMTRFGVAAATALAVMGGAAGAASAFGSPGGPGGPSFGGGFGARAAPVFVQTDNTAGNQIVVYDSAADGALAQAGVYDTGGLGGVLADRSSTTSPRRARSHTTRQRVSCTRSTPAATRSPCSPCSATIWRCAR